MKFVVENPEKAKTIGLEGKKMGKQNFNHKNIALEVKNFMLSLLVLVLVGPAVMAAFFRFSSWLMDMRSLERRPRYKQVMDEVSAMIPWFPKIFPKKKTKEELQVSEEK